MWAGVYRISTPSGKTYIGSSTDVRRRKRQHMFDLKNNKHHSIRLQRSFNKYGFDAMMFEHICCLIPNQNLMDLEQMMIDQEKPQLNMTNSSYSPMRDPEVAKKQGETAKKSDSHIAARKRNAISAWAASSKRVVCLNNGQEYESSYAASRAMGFKRLDDISSAIASGWKCKNGFYWAYVGSSISLEERLKESEKREKERIAKVAEKTRSRCSRPVVRLSDGMIFSSLSEAGRTNGVTVGAIYNALRRYNMACGSYWKYVDTSTTTAPSDSY